VISAHFDVDDFFSNIDPSGPQARFSAPSFGVEIVAPADSICGRYVGLTTAASVIATWAIVQASAEYAATMKAVSEQSGFKFGKR
jgi:hypothetical protein